MPTVLLQRAEPRKVDWKLAAQLRAKGCTFNKVAELTGASSGESIRQGLNRRGVGVAIRTRVELEATEHAEESIQKASEATKSHLSRAVLEQSESLSKIKISRNLRSIKAFGTAIEPLARTAKIVYGWGEQSGKTAVNVNVLGSVSFDDLPMAGSVSAPTTDSVRIPDAVVETPQEPAKP